MFNMVPLCRTTWKLVLTLLKQTLSMEQRSHNQIMELRNLYVDMLRMINKMLQCNIIFL